MTPEHLEALWRTGQQQEAQGLLDEARATFEGLRARPWLERVERLELAPAEPAGVD